MGGLDFGASVLGLKIELELIFAILLDVYEAVCIGFEYWKSFVILMVLLFVVLSV